MSHGNIDVSAEGTTMNQNHPFVLEMAFRFVSLHRAGESQKALWLRKQRQAMTIDDDQLKDALAVLYRLPDQSAEAMEDWVRTRYLEDGLEKGFAQEGTEDPLWLLAAKAHTYHGDLNRPAESDCCGVYLRPRAGPVLW